MGRVGDEMMLTMVDIHRTITARTTMSRRQVKAPEIVFFKGCLQKRAMSVFLVLWGRKKNE